MQSDIQKITINIPAALLKNAMAITGHGITETVREGLEEIERRNACRDLAALRGKVKFFKTWQEMKEDRE